MKISQDWINLVKQFEGCRLSAYLCPSGVPTIGYGHTSGVSIGTIITQEKAEELLTEDLAKYEKYVNALKIDFNQHQFDALVSFTYNCGNGNLKNLCKDRTIEQIGNAILLYNKSNGIILNGIVRRRLAERELYIREDVIEEVKEVILPVDYKQTDSRWKSVPYAVDGEKSTIGSAGCGATAMADVLGALVSPYIDPLTCAAWSRGHGYKVYKSGTSYAFPCAIAKAYGVDCTRLNTTNVYGNPNAPVHEKAKEWLKNGGWLVACMGKGNWTSSGHYIVVYGIDSNDYVLIDDPASNKANRAYNTWELFHSQVKFYWAITVDNSKYDTTSYKINDFTRDIQLCIGANPDGAAGSETLGKTITVSKTKNRTHNVVYPLQKRLKWYGYYTMELDGRAGNGFDSATKQFQKEVVKLKTQDGEFTAKGKSWRKILGM